MSARELAWRAGHKLRDSLDRRALRRPPLLPSRCKSNVHSQTIARPWSTGALPAAADWPSRAAGRAERLLQHRFELFDLTRLDVGPSIDWNYEYKARKSTPRCFAADIDYRDFDVAGDAKFVWELNRHHHWVVLGRAFRWTGDRRYAEELARQLDSWIDQCPFGVGLNWRSPLELAIRLINWTWASELIRPSGCLNGARGARLLTAVHQQIREIARNYSRFSSANNHRIGEAAGVFLAASYFADLEGAAQWRAVSRRILLEELDRQVHRDGVHGELATGYHLFVMQFFLLAGLAGRNAGDDFPAEYWSRLERMFDYISALAAGGSALPMFGDADDGYVLDLGAQPGKIAEWLPVGAALFGRADFKAAAPQFSETAYWLLGDEGRARFDGLNVPAAPEELSSRAFPDAGYYLLQHGKRDAHDRISLMFDCGALGFGAIAAHGHADALSFTLRIAGTDVLVDPGTYDYFTYGPWRDYFRSTRAHNTIVIDDADQSQMVGPFLWGARARARCVHWEPSREVSSVSGEHDGYTRLPGAVTHRRTITLDGPAGRITVRDELRGGGAHRAALHLHLAEHCSARPSEQNVFEVGFGPGNVTVSFDPHCALQCCRGAAGDLQPTLGWVSRGYHRKSPSITLVAQRDWEERVNMVTEFSINRPQAYRSQAYYRTDV